MNDGNMEINNIEAPGKGFEQSVEQHLKRRNEQIEVPTSKSVMDQLNELNMEARKFARSIADNEIVKWIPVVSPLINASLDMQQAGVALMQGKDVDTGKDLTLPERAQMAISKYGNGLWEQTKVGIDLAFLAVGGTLVEKIGLKGAGTIVEHGAQLVAHEAISKGGDLAIYGKDGRKVPISADDPKMKIAEHVVDGMPGMYSEVAAMSKDADTKKLLNDASKTFGKMIDNPNTRAALASSLAQSEHIDAVMAKMTELKKDPDAVKNFTGQLTPRA